MDCTDHEPDLPGGREEHRRRQFENSRGLSERRELPLDDEPPADEPDAEEQSTGDDETSPDAEEELDDDEPGS